jgi:hypothetical protein
LPVQGFFQLPVGRNGFPERLFDGGAFFGRRQGQGGFEALDFLPIPVDILCDHPDAHARGPLGRIAFFNQPVIHRAGTAVAAQPMAVIMTLSIARPATLTSGDAIRGTRITAKTPPMRMRHVSDEKSTKNIQYTGDDEDFLAT